MSIAIPAEARNFNQSRARTAEETIILANGNGLLIDAINDVYLVTVAGASTYYASLSSMRTALGGAFTSAAKYYFNSAGNLVLGTANEPTIHYNATTGAKQGWRIEKERQQHLRNSAMAGGAAPSTLPTNMNVLTAANLTTEFVESGTDANGLEYARIRIHGTPNAGDYRLQFEAATQVVAANTDVWLANFRVRLAAGALTNIAALGVECAEYSAGPILVGNTEATFVPTSATTKTQSVHTFRVFGATAAFANMNLHLDVTSGLAIDITLDIAMPELGKGDEGTTEFARYPSSFVRTTTVAVERAQDFFSILVPAGIQSPTVHSILVDFIEPLVRPVRACHAFQFDDGSNADRSTVFLAQNTDQYQNFVVSASGTVANLLHAQVVNGSRRRIASRIKLNDFASSYGGAASVTDVAGNAPVNPLTTANLGSAGAINVGTQLDGFIRVFMFTHAELTNAQLEALSVVA